MEPPVGMGEVGGSGGVEAGSDSFDARRDAGATSPAEDAELVIEHRSHSVTALSGTLTDSRLTSCESSRAKYSSAVGVRSTGSIVGELPSLCQSEPFGGSRFSASLPRISSTRPSIAVW